MNQKASGQPQQEGAVCKSVTTMEHIKLNTDLRTPGEWRVLMFVISAASYTCECSLKAFMCLSPEARAKTKTSLLAWLPAKRKWLQGPIGSSEKEVETRSRVCIR